ncbi:HD-GYP domain-containing protein [Conexibacter sp. CPCC 206217]|uniref:HD-GYP domain-containing protein n=1 Tax=Conexibacter sp. CPCC 206217 TaxID=3064574 RepID=UPI00271593BF|nr:HD-GYP domain-containing protein [Conexibacter sp. CPCC 206217]MDO8214164.1 HD-GYP domain-containing protein [Conexibacter sp. CPCC 206217]
MRLISSQRLVPGTVVARDVRPGIAGTAPLVHAGTRLTPKMCLRLCELDVAAVWVDDELGEGIEPLEALSEETRDEAEREVTSTLAQARDALAGGQQLASIDVMRLRDVAAAIAQEVSGLPEAVIALSEMRSADAYTHEHSVRVTTLGLLLAARHWKRNGWIDHRGERRHDNITQRMTQLGFGLLVHDIGKLAIPREVLDRPGKLDADEWDLVRQHPELGAGMLNHTTTSMLAISVVRYHHERWDGGGYPRGLDGASISELARIAAVADVYDAVRSERPYKPAQPSHVGVDVVLEGSGTAFDPKIVETFKEVVMPYPAGHEIDLPDGRRGVVVAVDPTRPYSPRVRIAELERADGDDRSGNVDGGGTGVLTEVEIDLSQPPASVSGGG